MRTYAPKADEITREWHVIDADGLVLGRLATAAARLLIGKHKPTFAPYIDIGDHVVIVNADKVVLTGDKLNQKQVYRHSGYPGGLHSQTYGELLERRPADAVRKTIAGMLPHNRLGAAQLRKLKVYAGPDHPHGAQSPQPLTVERTGKRTRRGEVASRSLQAARLSAEKRAAK